jgi:hypothetical protein
MFCFASRDPFTLEQRATVGCNLQETNADDLSFVGAVQLIDVTIGFVSDTVGNICQLKVGQSIGNKKSEVLRILPDQIVISDGQHYIIIK